MAAAAQRSELSAGLREAERALQARNYRRAHELCMRVLAHDPPAADAFFLLGMIAAEHGNFAKAADVMGRAIRLDSERAEYYAHLGRCLVALSRPREAFEAAQRALALQPEEAYTLDTIGVVMTRAGAPAEALEPFARAVAHDGNKASYHYNLGASLQFLGKFAAAEQEYRCALAVDPGFCKAWSSLAQVRRGPFSAHDLATLEAMIASGALDADAELHLRHAMARHCEEGGQHAAAFRHLEAGKRRKREASRYSIEGDQALFAAAARVCTREFLAGGGGCESAEPIFIVGMPRTGTTLIERILSSHPDVFAAGELTAFALALKRAARTSSNLVLDAETLAAAAQVDLAQVGHEYLESTRPRTGHTRHFTDKMPLNFFYAGIIHRALPRAKIICVRRNPLDTCLSNYRQLFATNFPYYNYAYDPLDTGRYYLMFDALMKLWRELIPDRLCEVEYEAVVRDTQAEARRMLAFCGLDWHPACLQFHENQAPVTTASSVQVRQPIYAAAIDRWRKYEVELGPLIDLLNTHRPAGNAALVEPHCATSEAFLLQGLCRLR